MSLDKSHIKQVIDYNLYKSNKWDGRLSCKLNTYRYKDLSYRFFNNDKIEICLQLENGIRSVYLFTSYSEVIKDLAFLRIEKINKIK